jgi:tetratricopeptide (TPR) repeat protein
MAQAESLRDHDQAVAGVKLLDKALVEHPQDHDLLYTRALLAERLGRVDQLESDLRLILASDPDNAHALNALGYTLADRTDRYQEAHEFIERALQLIPEDAAILDSMGWVLYRLERYDEALVYLRRAYELSPDQEIAAHLGEVLWVSGEREQAMEVWNAELKRVDEAPQVKRTMQRFGI